MHYSGHYQAKRGIYNFQIFLNKYALVEWLFPREKQRIWAAFFLPVTLPDANT
jgi:hypothetical protein